MKNKKFVAPLAVLAIAAVILFGASVLLKPIAAANKEKDIQQIRTLLLPGSEVFTEEIYEGEDTNITAVYKAENGYVIETKVAGYVDDIVTMVGVDASGAVTGVYIMDMNETFGLGRRAMTDLAFLGQYIGTKGEAEIGTDIDALSGATVTSKAVTKAVNSAAAYVTGADVSSGATEWGG